MPTRPEFITLHPSQERQPSPSRGLHVRNSLSNSLTFLGIATLSVVSFGASNGIAGSPSPGCPAVATEMPTSFIPPVTREGQDEDGSEPNTGYREVTILPESSNGEIGFTALIELWFGDRLLAKMPEWDKPTHLAVFVYHPEDPNGEGEPLTWWVSPAIPATEGLTELSIPVSVPMLPNAEPYPVKVKLGAALPETAKTAALRFENRFNVLSSKSFAVRVQ